MLTYRKVNKIVTDFSKDYKTKFVKDKVTYKTDCHWFSVYYKKDRVFDVSTEMRYRAMTTLDDEELSKLPFGNELSRVLNELSMTALIKRGYRFNVIIGQDAYDDADDLQKHCIVWTKDLLDMKDKPFYLSQVSYKDLGQKSVVFSETQYQKLLAFINHLPNPEIQLQVAKLGKQVALVYQEVNR